MYHNNNVHFFVHGIKRFYSISYLFMLSKCKLQVTVPTIGPINTILLLAFKSHGTHFIFCTTHIQYASRCTLDFRPCFMEMKKSKFKIYIYAEAYFERLIRILDT